jgi:hypothetical protein
MARWWETPTAAWAFLVVGIGGSGVVAYLSPRIGIPVCVLLIVIGIVLLIRAYRRRDKRTQDSDIVEYLKDILAKMHDRTLKLKDEARKQYFALFTPKDFEELLNNITNAMYEDKVLLAKVKKGARRRKLSGDKIRRRQQIDGLSDKLNPIREMKLDKVVAFGNELDRFPRMQNDKYEGIKTRREKDKQWRTLFENLSATKLGLSDKDLDKIIDDHIDYSFAVSSVCLMTELFNKYTPVDIQPTEYIASGTYAPYAQMQNRMTQLLEDMANRVREILRSRKEGSQS